VYATSDFSSGTLAPFTNPWGTNIAVIADPTASGRGNVVELTYVCASLDSNERAVTYTHPSRLRYGQTIWMAGDLYIPTGFANQTLTDNRKLIDYQGGGVRMTLHVRNNDLRLSIVDWMNGTEQETIAETTGYTLNADTWYTLQVRMTTNSADNIRDGVLAVYANGASTPFYTRTTGLGWITEAFAGGSYFDTFLAGFQLTVSGATGYTEKRYWDNITYASGRIL
jgi:hypothetical protein